MGRNYSDLLEKSLDGSRLELLHLLAYQASILRMPLYLVGGVVRDILLGRPVKDFDLVVEGDSAVFAESIVKKFGGRVLIHSKFGTASWVLNESTFKRLDIPSFQLLDTPLSFDLNSARTETYAQPGALPAVKRSTIDDDVRRRDFTINAMAFRLEGGHAGELFDPLDGQKDLENKLIRVLHPKSFVDDPTRMFRAIRYSMRYQFNLEPATHQALFDSEARTVLSQLSGERIRHEFDLMFEEENAGAMLERLKEMDLLNAIHPALLIADNQHLPAFVDKPEQEFGEFIVPEILSFKQTLGWVLYLLKVTGGDIDAIAKRLAFPMLLNKATRGASALNNDLASLKDWKPSQWTFYLDEIPALAVYAVYLVQKELALREYLTTWRNVKPYTTGYTLQQRGLEPGPKYGEILRQLRAAWLDGELKTEAEEKILFDKLVK